MEGDVISLRHLFALDQSQKVLSGFSPTTHQPNLDIVVAYKGGEVRCLVAECSCFHSLDFDPKTAPQFCDFKAAHYPIFFIDWHRGGP